MVKHNYSVDDDDDSAKFNEAAFIMRRLNNLQDRMNLLRSNIISFNEELNDYNYHVFFNDTCSLLSETWAKLDEDERKDCEKIRNLLKEAFNKTPPHKRKVVLGKSEIKFDKKTWDIIEDVLFTFERKVKCYMDKHGMGNPNADDRGL